MQVSFKAVIEDSSRNKFMFYYSGSSVCCKEVSKDGVTKDTIIASQVTESFLTAIDTQDNLHVLCINRDKGLYLFSYANSEWKLDQILNIQDSDNLELLSLFVHNGSIHIIYAKQLAIANFYNIHHLCKPSSPSSYHLNTSWRKNNVGEIYSERLDSAYSAAITKDGVLHLVYEWFDGSSYQINYSWYDNSNNAWKKKPITTLFKKDISVCMLYEENILHLLCYTFEDEISAIFYYNKKDTTGKDFEFSCLDKIKTDQEISPYFHLDSGSIYASWVNGKKYSQYSLSKEQKNWAKKLDNIIPEEYNMQLIQFVRNRRGKSLIIRKTYFTVDHKNNLSLPYFKDSSTGILENYVAKTSKTDTGELISYVPYILDELKALTQAVKELQDRIDNSGGVKQVSREPSTAANHAEAAPASKYNVNNSAKLKKSSFKEQFMGTNKLLSRPESAALYVGSSAIPNPEELTKKDSIDIVENNNDKLELPVSVKQAPPVPASAENTESKAQKASPSTDNNPLKQEHDSSQKDTNLFKKIGDFFK